MRVLQSLLSRTSLTVPLYKLLLLTAVYQIIGGVSGKISKNYPRLALKEVRVSFCLTLFGSRGKQLLLQTSCDSEWIQRILPRGTNWE